MPLPDLSFLNPLSSGRGSGQSTEPDEPVSKVRKFEEKEDSGEPMMFQMDDIDSPADERASGSVDKVAPRRIGIGFQPWPRELLNERVSEEVSDTSLPALEDSVSLPSGLSDESSRVPSPGSPKAQLATSAPSSFSASPPHTHLLPVRSASALPHLKLSTLPDMGIQSAQHMHEMDIASDTSSSIKTIPVSNEPCLEEKMADFRISATSFVPDETATGHCASAEPSQLTQSERMSPREHSTAINISNSRFKIEVVSDSSIETCTETTSLDEESPVQSLEK